MEEWKYEQEKIKMENLIDETSSSYESDSESDNDESNL